ncbi:MAG TPA: hypothetical protein VJN89_09630 [Candidatus Acidoferrum sp.]|nr:hypothetical protein [Candidatus Acidoferrum sp.]
MNVVELLTFLLLCAGLGFVGHLFSPQWGWLAGAIPAGLGLLVMLVATIRALFRHKR